MNIRTYMFHCTFERFSICTIFFSYTLQHTLKLLSSILWDSIFFVYIYNIIHHFSGDGAGWIWKVKLKQFNIYTMSIKLTLSRQCCARATIKRTRGGGGSKGAGLAYPFMYIFMSCECIQVRVCKRSRINKY